MWYRYQETIKLSANGESEAQSPENMVLNIGIFPRIYDLLKKKQKTSLMGPGAVYSLQDVNWLLPALVLVSSPVQNCDMFILGSHILRH